MHNPPANVVELEKTLSRLTAEKADNREKRKELARGPVKSQEAERALQACKSKHDILTAQIQGTTEALKAARDAYESTVGYFGLDFVGLGYECRGPGVADSLDDIMWMTYEEDLWEWK